MGAGGAGGGWWDLDGAISFCVGAWAAKGANSLIDSYTDLSGNDDLTVGSTPGWNATEGWKFTNDYLITTIVPTNDQNYSVAVRFTNHTDGYTIGTRQGVVDFGMMFGFGRFHNGGYKNYTGKSSGVKILTGNLGYYNGTVVVSGITGYAGNPMSYPIFIGCRNNSGIADSFTPGYIQAVSIYSDVLTAIQVSDLTDAMNVL